MRAPEKQWTSAVRRGANRRRRWGFLVSAAVLLGLAACAPGTDALVSTCQTRMDAREYPPAVEACAAAAVALEAEPDPDEAADGQRLKTRQLLMRARFQTGDLDGALRDAAPLLVRDGPMAADAWRIVGRVHERAGRATEARTAFQTALDGHLARGDHKEAAYDAHALAGSHWRAGEYRLALTALLRTQDEARLANDERMVGYALLGVGTLLHQVGETAGAERAFASAAKHLGALNPQEQSNLLIERGTAQLAAGRPGMAREHFNEALKYARDAKSARYERAALENLARVDISLDRVSDAAANTTAAAALIDQDPDQLDTVFIHYLEGRVARRQGRISDARRAFDLASGARPVPEMVWRIELERGHALSDAGDAAGADAAWRRSIAAIEAMRVQLGVEELKRAFLGVKRAPYEALFTAQATSGRSFEAVTTVERALARSFLDAFLVPPSPPGAGPVTARPGDEAASGAPEAAPPSPEAHWNAAADRADQLKSLLSSLTASGVSAPRPMDEVLSRLGSRTLLTYFEASGAAWLIRVQGGPAEAVTLRKLTATPEEIARLADALISQPDAPSASAALSGALELEALLPAPAADRNTPLYLAPTGPLLRVPLGLLVGSSGKPLALEHAVVLVPSASALAAMLGAAPVAYGPPVVLGDAQEDLPFAAQEAVSVSQRLGVAPRLGAEATTAALRAAGRPRVLHVATHAGNGPAGPYLALADAHLGTGALLELHLDAELVVLASCASAAGEAREMWGSLASTFLAGGARNVLATLRSVDDALARRFVNAFYAAGGARRPAAAFAQAQRALSASGPPSTWAHFVLLGMGDPAPSAVAPVARDSAPLQNRGPTLTPSSGAPRP